MTGVDEESTAAAAKGVRGQIAFYGSTPAYRGVLELHGWGDLQGDLNRMSKEGRWKEMGGLIDDEMLEAFAVVAPFDEVAAKVAARWGDVLARFSFYSFADLPAEDWAELANAIKAESTPA